MQIENKSISPVKILLVNSLSADCSIVSIDFINALRNQNELRLKIFSCSYDSFGPGLYLSDKHFITAKPDNERQYIGSILKICKRENVSIIFPLLPSDYTVFSCYRQNFEVQGIRMPISGKKFIDICTDKKLQHVFFNKNHIPEPKYISHASQIKPRGWYMLKHRHLSGGQYIFRVKGKDIFHIPDSYILQKYIHGKEYSIDCFINKNHQLMSHVIRERIVNFGGNCMVGKTVRNESVSKLVQKIFTHLPLQGIVHVQIVKELKSGKLMVFEINPRPANGALALSIRAGANLPLLWIKDVLNLPITEAECTYKANVYISRYFTELLFYGKPGKVYIPT